jgi:hypothetical protein
MRGETLLEEMGAEAPETERMAGENNLLSSSAGHIYLRIILYVI